MFVQTVVYRVRTGGSWRDLPERFGGWNTAGRRFRRWATAGGWESLFQAVQEPDYAWVLIDSTTLKAHKAAAGQKKYAQAAALGRSRGGFSTKRHAVVDAWATACTGCVPQAHSSQLPGLLDTLREAPGAVVADKAYDPNAVLAALAQPQSEAVLPPKANRLAQRA